MLPSKMDTMLSALDQPASRPGTVLVTFLAEAPGVEIPPEFLEQKNELGAIAFNYSYRHRPPPSVGKEGITATLARGGKNFHTFVPWSAVGVIEEVATGVVVLWPHAGRVAGDEPTKETPTKRAGGHLRLIPALTGDAEVGDG